jgi:hypothetical protein
MSMTPENTTRSWRDMADQLTPEQAEWLEERERDPDSLVRATGNPDHRVDDDSLLFSARRYAGNNLAAAMIGDVPAPAGAVKLCEWGDPDTQDAFRLFWGATRSVKLDDDTEIDVIIRGTQSADGTVEEHGILIEGGSDDVMTTGDVRRLAAALLEAADDIDRSAAR